MGEHGLQEARRLSESIFSGRRRTGIARRVSALFRAMATDFLLREQFVTDPSQVLSDYVFETRLPVGPASIANQLLYSLMSNNRMLLWLQDYVNEHAHHFQSHREFVHAFGHAASSHGRRSIVFSLLRSSVEEEGAVAFSYFETTLLSLATIIRPNPIEFTGTGTTGTGTTGTGTTGTGTTGTGTTGTGTTGTGTGIVGLTGLGAQGDPLDLPDYAQITFNQLIQYSYNQLDLGLLDIAIEANN